MFSFCIHSNTEHTETRQMYSLTKYTFDVNSSANQEPFFVVTRTTNYVRCLQTCMPTTNISFCPYVWIKRSVLQYIIVHQPIRFVQLVKSIDKYIWVPYFRLKMILDLILIYAYKKCGTAATSQLFKMLGKRGSHTTNHGQHVSGQPSPRGATRLLLPPSCLKLAISYDVGYNM